MEVNLVMSDLKSGVPTSLQGINVWRALGSLVSASATVTAVGALAAFVVIFAYLHEIGSPELIGKALAAPSEVWPWVVVSSLLLVSYLLLLLLTTASYAVAVNLFKKTPDVQRAMAGYLLIPTLAGVVATVCSTLLTHNTSVVPVFVDSAVWVVIGMLVLFFIPKFTVLLDKAISGDKAVHCFGVIHLKHMSALAMATWVAAIAATFPMLAVLSTPSLFYSQGGVSKAVFISIFITILGFVPAIAFYVSRGETFVRVRNAFFGVVALIIGTLVIVPSAVPAAVDQAAVLAGIKDVRVFPYMLKETYAAEDFDRSWGNVVTKRNYPVVEGLVLFTLGGVTLLCPKSLESTDLSRWASKSGACLTMNNKMVKRMPLKQT